MITKCPRCGSEKIIPGVPVRDRYGDVGAYSASAEVRVHGEPEAWVFKDTSAASLLVDICGECGAAELRVDGYRELYAKYVKSLGR
jgi:hypothetical protein